MKCETNIRLSVGDLRPTLLPARVLSVLGISRSPSVIRHRELHQTWHPASVTGLMSPVALTGTRIQTKCSWTATEDPSLHTWERWLPYSLASATLAIVVVLMSDIIVLPVLRLLSRLILGLLTECWLKLIDRRFGRDSQTTQEAEFVALSVVLRQLAAALLTTLSSDMQHVENGHFKIISKMTEKILSHCQNVATLTSQLWHDLSECC